jgi:hypothetical protein
MNCWQRGSYGCMVGVRARVHSFTLGSLVTLRMIEHPVSAFHTDVSCPCPRSLLVVLSAVLFGRRGSLIFQAGRRLLAKRDAKALGAGEVEDPRLMRFNNTIAAILLGGAQLALLLGLEAVGWGSRWRWLPRRTSPWRAYASVASSITGIGRTVLGCLGRPRGACIGTRSLSSRPELTVRISHNEREGQRFSSRDSGLPSCPYSPSCRVDVFSET